MSLRDEMGSEALRGAQRKRKEMGSEAWRAQRKKKRNGFRREEHNEKRKEMGSEERRGARQVGVKKNE